MENKLRYLLACCLVFVILSPLLFWRLGYLPPPAPCGATAHQSYLSGPAVFDAAYSLAGKTKRAPLAPAQGVIVNHHLLAAHLIAETFSAIATDKPVTVLLISPNHFSAGQGEFISSLSPWDTPYGALLADCDAGAKIAAAAAELSTARAPKFFSFEEKPFLKEHGVSGIVPFIRRSLPNARIVPIIVREGATHAEVQAFAGTLEKALGQDFIVVGSFDFSHYLPGLAARFHDEASLSALRAADSARIRAAETDSPAGLDLVLELMRRRGAGKFVLSANTDSSELLGEPSLDETTSYIDGAFYAGTPANDRVTTMLVLPAAVGAFMPQSVSRFLSERDQRFLSGADRTIIAGTPAADGVWKTLGISASEGEAVGIVTDEASSTAYYFPVTEKSFVSPTGAKLSFPELIPFSKGTFPVSGGYRVLRGLPPIGLSKLLQP